MEQPEPRRRDATATRARILAAAQRAFWAEGYDRTGIRDIAGRAGTSTTLLLRYFGSKAGLFEAALRDAMRVDALLAVPREAFARTLADIFLRTDLDVTPPASIGVLARDPDAARIAARVMEEQIVTPIAAWLGGPRARARAVEMAMLATGFVVYARQMPLAGAPPDPAVVDWFVGAMQALVDAPSSPDAPD